MLMVLRYRLVDWFIDRPANLPREIVSDAARLMFSMFHTFSRVWKYRVPCSSVTSTPISAAVTCFRTSQTLLSSTVGRNTSWETDQSHTPIAAPARITGHFWRLSEV